MNGLMILGICIIVLGLIVSLGLYYKICYKNKNGKAYIRFMPFILLIIFTLLGGFFAQSGADKSRLEFTESELALINSNESYTNFTDEEKVLFSALQSKYLLNKEDKVEIYHDIILNMAVDQYLSENSHRTDLTRNDAEQFVLKNWEEKRKFNK